MRNVIAITIAAWSFLVASPALAQTVPDWTEGIRLGKPLFITLLDGSRIEGSAGSVSPDGIVVATAGGVRTARFGDLRRVERRDALWTGAAIGAAVGFAIGLGAILGDSVCPDRSSACRSEAAAVPMGGALYGALIGWGVDALVKGRSTLFESGAPRVSVAAGRGGLAARVTVSW